MSTDISTIPLLTSLPAEEQEAILAKASTSWHLPGTKLAEAGEHAYKFFAVLHGSVDVVVHGVTVATEGVGGIIGEMALVEDDRRNADLVAGPDLQILSIMSWDFRNLLESCPAFSAAMDDLIEQRKAERAARETGTGA